MVCVFTLYQTFFCIERHKMYRHLLRQILTVCKTNTTGLYFKSFYGLMHRPFFLFFLIFFNTLTISRFSQLPYYSCHQKKCHIFLNIVRTQLLTCVNTQIGGTSIEGQLTGIEIKTSRTYFS